MAIIQPAITNSGARGSQRRVQALVSILRKDGVEDISQVDKFNPAIRAATLGELEEAIGIIKSCGLRKISKRISKVLVNGKAFIGQKEEEWRSVDNDRFKDLKFSPFLFGISFILFNKVEILQVCYKISHPHGIYHLQSVVTGQVFGMFCMEEGKTDGIMQITRPTPRWIAPRSATQVITDRMFREIVECENKNPIDGMSDLHNEIVSYINADWGSNF